MLLVDSNIIIDHLRGVPEATRFVQVVGKEGLAVSTVVEMELYNGVYNRAQYAKVRKTLLGFARIEINESISHTALLLSQKYALSHHLSVADTLIAATALVYDLELRTYNLKDFRFIPRLRVSNSLV